MSIRGLWIVREDRSGDAAGFDVVFSRRYPTVERRSKLACDLQPEAYFALPEDSLIAADIVKKSRTADEKFVEERDDCALVHQRPVYSLFQGKLWPVVCIVQYGLIYCAVALVESVTEDKSDLLNIPGVPIALSLLESLAELVGSNTSAISPSHPKMMEIYQCLCYVAPFGTLLETGAANMKALMLTGHPQSALPSQHKQFTAVKSSSGYKGTLKLVLHIREEVRSMQYDNQNIPDVGEVFGSIICKAELESGQEVQLTVSVPPNSSPLDYVVVHPCVTLAEADPIVMQAPGISVIAPLLNRKMRFLPPQEQFTLCSYTLSDLSFLPIRGFYQVKGDGNVLKLLVQLKLDKSVKNNFEKCEVHLPFYHKGPIEKVDNISPISVQLTLSQEKYKIIWNIGQKFPTKSLELFLQASVHFPSVIPPVPKGIVEDPFCTGLNSYVEIHFKLTDYMISGCHIDQKSVALFPSVKCKLNTSRECFSGVYKIWNSHGDVQSVFPPPKKA